MSLFFDYPGFNMRIAKWARKSDLKHIITSPQIWAWKETESKKSNVMWIYHSNFMK
jgi:lipid-A-disaccharide synthase